MSKKSPEPSTKLDVIHDNIINALLKKGIINDKHEILDKEAFVSFITSIKKAREEEFAATEKDGVVIDQYAYNLLGTEIEYLHNMLTQMTVAPSTSESPYPNPENLESYFQRKDERKKQQSRLGKFMGKLFKRDR